MPGRINDEDIEALRERADIAAVVGEHTTLRRAGSRLKGLCPFHEERTPSFTVDQARGLFHCFGCNVGGDLFGFLQRAEALSFPEAVERLARMVGYELRYEQLSPGQRRALGRRTRLVEALGEAAAFYRRALAGEEGAAARAYLERRGLDAAALERFGLGWAPDHWEAVVRHLRERGFGDDEIAACGLASQGSQGRPIDRFRGRVMFPILDPGGRDVLAFGGRTVPDAPPRTGPREGEPPKYINSPETEVYKKARTLYGLCWARAEIQRRDTALVVEGYMDVLALQRVGIGNAVATCGTALTVEHFRQLERFARRVVLALDADDAGFAAAERARELAEEAGVREAGVLPLPGDTDPADLAEGGAEAVEAALGSVKTAVQFQIEYLLRTADTSTPEGQVEAYRRTFPLLARLGDRFLRFTYIRDVVAPAVRLSADRIERELDGELSRQPDLRHAPTNTAPTAGGDGQQRPGDLAGAGPRDPQLRLERDVLRAAVQTPELLPEQWAEVGEEDFRAPQSRQLFAVLRAQPAGDLDAVLEALPDDETRARVRALALSEPTVEPDRAHVAELVARLRAAAVQREIDAIEERMDELREQLPADERRRLTARHFELVRRRHALLAGQGGG